MRPDCMIKVWPRPFSQPLSAPRPSRQRRAWALFSLTPSERRNFRICAGSPTGKAFGGYLMSLRIHRYQRQRPAQLTMCQTLVAILLKSTHRYASTIHSPTGTPLDCNVDYQRTVLALLLLLEHSYNHTSRQLIRRE